MSPWLALLVVLAGILLVLWMARRDLEVFHLEVERGHVSGARGRMPPEMMRELHDVLERSKATGSVTGRIEGGRVVLHVEGIDEHTTQRLRNVTGRFHTARIRQGKRLG